MNEDFVPFELSKKLKEKGFPQRTFGSYDMVGPTYFSDGRFYKDGCICHKDEAYTAPTISQVLKWMREKKGMEVYPNYNRVYKHWIYIARAFDDSCYNSVGGFKSYEQAALAGIEYTLNNLI